MRGVSRRFQAVVGASRGLQAAPGALRPAAYCQRGWTRPPTMARGGGGGWGGGQLEACLQRGVEGVFKGI